MKWNDTETQEINCLIYFHEIRKFNSFNFGIVKKIKDNCYKHTCIFLITIYLKNECIFDIIGYTIRVITFIPHAVFERLL